MAARGAWFHFGFRVEAAAAGPAAVLEPVPLGEAVLRVRPSWSFVALVTAAKAAAAEPGLPSEASPPPAGLGRRVELRGGGVGAALAAGLPGDCLDARPSESHVLLVRPAALEGWPVPGPGERLLEGEPAWRRELRPGEAAALAAGEGPALLLPGGYAAPRPPFFTPLPGALRAERLALGHEHALLLATGGGGLFSWGGGRHGQLGHGDLESRAEPQPVEALQGVPVAGLAAGGWHSAALGASGDLYLWGWNESGQLGLPSKALAESPGSAAAAQAGQGDSENGPPGSPKAAFISIQAFPALLDLPQEAEVLKVSCGSRHTAAVTSTGDLYTWGWGRYGQLGHGDTASSDQPRKVGRFADWNFCVFDVTCGPWATYAQAGRTTGD